MEVVFISIWLFSFFFFTAFITVWLISNVFVDLGRNKLLFPLCLSLFLPELGTKSILNKFGVLFSFVKISCLKFAEKNKLET